MNSEVERKKSTLLGVEKVELNILAVILAPDGAKFEASKGSSLIMSLNCDGDCSAGFDGKVISPDGCIGELHIKLTLAGHTHTSKSYYSADDKTYVCLIGLHLTTI